MVFIIGDIHGEITKLKELIKNICHIDATPSFIFVGDYIDKGENAKDTLDYLIRLAKLFRCDFVMGNHEYFWIKVNQHDEKTEQYLVKYGGSETMRSFQCKNILETKQQLTSAPYNSFFSELLPYIQYKHYTIVHSGIPPEFYQTKPESISIERLLMNRYDFISSNEYYLGEYKVVFGHTGFYTPYYDVYKIGIDTAACFLEAQPLTAFNADEEYFVDSNNNRYQLSSLNVLCCPNIIRNKPWRTSNDQLQ